MSDAIDGAVDAAAIAAWENDHPGTPWAQAPESVRAAMRGLVRPTVEAVFDHLAFNDAITGALSWANGDRIVVETEYRGVPLVAYPGDTWQAVANRYSEAAQALQ